MALTLKRDVIGLHSWSLTVNWSFEGHEVGYDAAYLASWLYPQILVGSRRYLADAPYDSSRLEIRWTPGEIRFLFPFRHTERSLLLSPGWRGTLYSPRDPLPYPTTPQEQGFRSEVTFSLAYSDARRFVNSISLEEGRIVTFHAAVASKALGSDYAFALGRVALDQYFRVPFTRHWVLALHLAAGAAAGTMCEDKPSCLTRLPVTQKPVNSKTDFVLRYGRGEFGNASVTYQTWQELNCCGSSIRKYHLRSRVAGGPTLYNLDYFQAIHRWIESENPGDWYCSEMAPHDRGTIQGELQQSTEHLDLTYSIAQVPMRQALLTAQFATGVKASMLLQAYMDPASWDWVNYLLDAYSGHVIEFYCFDVCWGTVPHRNTVIWEVRNY